MTGSSKIGVAIIGSSNSLVGLLVHRLLGDARFGPVVLVDADPPSGGDTGVKHYALDISQSGSEERVQEILEAEGVEVVVHLSLSTTLTRTPALAHEMETQGTMHVLNACSARRIRKLVLMSTTLLYGAAADNSPWLGEESLLKADRSVPFFADKMEAEGASLRFGERNRDCMVTILRIGPVLGPNTRNIFTEYLGPTLVPVMAGFDPPVQLMHEVDAIRAFLIVLAEDHPGVFNIVGDSVVPLVTAVRVLGHAPVPIMEPMMTTVLDGLWMFRLVGVPSVLVPYLKYPVLASGDKAAHVLGFTTSYPAVEVLGDFARALRRQSMQASGDGKEAEA